MILLSRRYCQYQCNYFITIGSGPYEMFDFNSKSASDSACSIAFIVKFSYTGSGPTLILSVTVTLSSHDGC